MNANELPNHNLPLPLTSFIGRQAEKLEITRQLSSTRLLTLTGPGGCGKTRLSLEVAASLVEKYADGVGWVELAPVQDEAFVPQAVINTFGLHERPGQPALRLLADFLRPRHLLLVLDNCEHLMEACARLAVDLLSACPKLRLLATSREALNIPGEAIYLVPSLALPPASEPANTMLHNEAVRLFFERAQAVSPDFALTEKTAPIIAQICQRLDGMPLAIELAAARVRVLSLEQIAARLDQRFSLLASGSRTVTARQQTLRATIDWSYALLTEAEQALFRRGSVFVGGWSIEAAEQICRGDPLASGEFLDTLDRLVKKSLVIAEIHGVEARFHMLETIRQYAFERLLESGEEWEIDARHLSFFLGLAEKARPLLSGPEQVAWLNRLEVEHDNLRLALRWALENAQASSEIDPVQRSRLRQEALRLAGSLGDFWYMHGHWSEGRRWLQQALDQNTEDVTSIKAWALVKAGTLAVFQNDYAQAQALLDESFSLFQILGEKHGLGRTLFYLAMIASDQGDNPLSIRYVEESLALEKEVGDREGQAFSLHLLGEILNGLGEPQRAISYFQPSLALFREMGNQWAIALSLVTLGASAYYLGDYAQAAALEQEGLDRWRELGDTRMIAIALYELGRATLGLRDFTKTMAYWKESLQIFKNVGDRDFFNQCLEGLATLACRQRQWKRAARMYAAASAYRQEIGVPVYDADRAQLEQSLSMIKAGIGEEEFKKAWSEGSQMSPEQALEYASQVDETVLQGEHASTSTPLKRAKAQYGGLTAREREVAALIAKGRSNTEIARELYVGLRTVEAHVTAILTKLSFHSRTQIAGWAIDKGLAPPPR